MTNDRCKMCGHEADDTPNGSFDIMLFKKMGRKTFGPVNDEELCEYCAECFAELEADSN